MSKRKRVIKVPKEPDESKVKRKGWSQDDKTNLLTALKTYGHTDIESISTMIPNKTKPAIRTMINKIMNKAKKLSTGRNCALDTWLTSGMFDEKTPPIPEALKYIALFEDHPSPEESGGFDFRAAYDYLHRMTLGLPAIDIPQGTLEKINELMDQARNEVWPAAEPDVVDYLRKLEKEKDAIKCYPPRKTKRNYWINEEEEGGSSS